MVALGANRYGKAEVRVVHVARDVGGRDILRDWNVSSSLSGDLTAVHLSGDNAHVLPTDTQKNTVHALLQELGDVEPEQFALRLAEHFVSTQEAINRARVTVQEFPWLPNPISGHSFVRSGQYVRGTTVVHDVDQGVSVISGVDDLVVLNTTDSEFWGYARDQYTTLPETKDRILATEVRAWWRYRDLDVPWADAYAQAFQAIQDAFAGTYSYSLQQTLYVMGQRVIETVPQICEVRLTLPNKHHFLVDLEPFGLANDNEVYHAADRPYGLIEGTVLADDAEDAGLSWS